MKEEDNEEFFFDKVKFDKELKRKNNIKNIVKGTLALSVIIGSYSFGYFVGSFNSTPIKVYESKIKIGYYQYEADGYIVKNKKGDKYSFKKECLARERETPHLFRGGMRANQNKNERFIYNPTI